MNTDDIADVLDITAKLMELHEENPFKVKALASAAYKLSKTRLDLTGKGPEEIEKIEGIGKSISAKIIELMNTGTTQEFESYKTRTPLGVIDMLGIKGLGPKKVRQLWKELELESVGELLYACNENRLVDLKGFGPKTQESIRVNIEFSQGNSGKLHYASAEREMAPVLKWLHDNAVFGDVSPTGEMRRKCDIITKMELLAATDDTEAAKSLLVEKGFTEDEAIENAFVSPNDGCKIYVYLCGPDEFYRELFLTSGSPEFSDALSEIETEEPIAGEEDIFDSLQLQYIEPELRETPEIIGLARDHKIPQLVEYTDLKGILHNHSTYSDGMHTLEQMATHCKDMGFEYFGICDHSQSAFYADGLKPEKVLEQQEEIDRLNRKLAPFRIFKGIESDILNDGRLDYEEDILKTFDFVVASVHSNLKMNEEKATQRLIKAIENPYTTILGHPTGRLLLARQGYPIDHKKVIDACAANGVVIELNAHPYRLDIDWRWIPYCVEKGVKISINPDAHQVDGLADMRYGLNSARKGMLTKAYCFNALSLVELEAHFKSRKK